MLGDPHLVVTELLGQLEEAKILIETLHHAGEIWDLAQAEDPKLRLGHAVPPRAVVQGILMSQGPAVKPGSRRTPTACVERPDGRDCQPGAPWDWRAAAGADGPPHVLPRAARTRPGRAGMSCWVSTGALPWQTVTAASPKSSSNSPAALPAIARRPDRPGDPSHRSASAARGLSCVPLHSRRDFAHEAIDL